jgi:hypothetical protein
VLALFSDVRNCDSHAIQVLVEELHCDGCICVRVVRPAIRLAGAVWRSCYRSQDMSALSREQTVSMVHPQLRFRPVISLRRTSRVRAYQTHPGPSARPGTHPSGAVQMVCSLLAESVDNLDRPVFQIGPGSPLRCGPGLSLSPAHRPIGYKFSSQTVDDLNSKQKAPIPFSPRF